MALRVLQANAGVVDQDVDRTQIRRQFPHKGLERIGLVHVQLHDMDPALELRGDLAVHTAGAARQHHRVSLAQQFDATGQADATGSTRDQRQFS
ncbi:hypothetical protein D3C85_778260 [compost metagenome]